MREEMYEDVDIGDKVFTDRNQCHEVCGVTQMVLISFINQMVIKYLMWLTITKMRCGSNRR